MWVWALSFTSRIDAMTFFQLGMAMNSYWTLFGWDQLDPSDKLINNRNVFFSHQRTEQGHGRSSYRAGRRRGFGLRYFLLPPAVRVPAGQHGALLPNRPRPLQRRLHLQLPRGAGDVSELKGLGSFAAVAEESEKTRCRNYKQLALWNLSRCPDDASNAPSRTAVEK